MFFYFFFFQAEDGIRDWSVTGVQTCALPISAKYGQLGDLWAWQRSQGTAGFRGVAFNEPGLDPGHSRWRVVLVERFHPIRLSRCYAAQCGRSSAVPLEPAWCHGSATARDDHGDQRAQPAPAGY